jgi:type II secretion system protein C
MEETFHGEQYLKFMGKRLFWLSAFLLMTANSFLAAELLVTKINTKLETLADLEIALDSQVAPIIPTGNYSGYTIINERNLFRTAGLKKKEEVEKPLEPPLPPVKPLTELKLQLLGTVVGSITSPLAIILNLRTKKQDIYRIGDAVTEEAKVVNIYRNKVILNHGGKEEMLVAFESQLALPGSDEKSASPSPQEQSKETTSRFDLGRLGKRVSRYHWELEREEVSQAIDNATQLLTQVRIIPHFNKGKLDKPDGFQISHVKPGGFFDKLGVMPGDIIKEVNGEPVNSPEKAFAAYQKFKNESNIQILIERQNQPQTLIYDIR